MADKSEFVMLKLRSGDEIIAKRNGAKSGFILLSRPLQLQRSTMIDPITGEVKRNICVFRDWLEFTTELNCEVPTDFVILESSPTPELVKRYLQEIEILDRPVRQKAKKRQTPPSQPENLNSLDEMVRNMMNPSQRNQEKDAESLDDILSRLLKDKPQSSQSQMVTASFSMPPDVFLNIIFNMPMFDGFGQEMPDDSGDDGDDGFGGDDGDDKDDPPSNQTPPKGKTPKKPNKGDDDTPPPNWKNPFGFPK